MADVVYFDSGTVLPFCPSTVNGIYISGSGCCSDFYTAFVGGNQTYNLTYTLPTSSGSSGQVLTNDGNGNLSWTSISGGAGNPAGNDGMIQYNNGGVFGGSTLLFWNDSTNRLGFNTSSPTQSVDIQGTLRLSTVTGTAETLMGRSSSGDVAGITIGTGLSLSGNVLSFTGSTGGGSGTVTGTGTTNYLSKWASASGLTNSIVLETGSTIDISGALRVTASSGTASTIAGQNSDGYFSNITVGTGLSLSGNILTTTGITAGTVTGTGTTNYLSKWASSSDLTNSIVLETGSTIDISGALRVTASSGTAISLMGRDINGYVSNLLLGNGLSISGGTLSFTGSTGVSGNFVPYLGATGNTDLGGFGIGGSYFQFSTSTGGTLQEGMATWNGSVGTVDLMLKGGNVTLPIGQGEVLRVRNQTGVNLTKAAYSAVRVTGSSGNFLTVDLALASGETTSAETIGIVTENINTSQEGFITVQGIIRGINTTGSLQGETWADGDMLFLSPSTPGGLTNIKPTAPNHLVIVGYVVRSDNNGIIFVKIDNGYELNELHNVLLPSSITNNEILAYDSVTKVWRNRTSGQLTLASGTGTTNYLTKWVSSSGLTNSIILETGSTVDIAGALRVTTVSGTATTIAGQNSNGYFSNISTGAGLSLNAGVLSLTGATGTGTTGYVSRWLSSSGLTDSVIFSTGTVVGINTTNPQRTLDVAGTMRLTGSTGVSSSLMGRSVDGDISGVVVDGGLSLSGNVLSVTGVTYGTGTTNYLTKWLSSSGLTNSIILETGSTIDIAGALRVTASSGTSTTLMGRDANGYVSGISVGSGLSLSGNTLTTTGSTGVSGSGTATQVAFWGGSTTLSGSSNLYWDNVNRRLGVGNNTPIGAVHIRSISNSSGTAIIIENPELTPTGLAGSSIYAIGSGQTTSGANNSELGLSVSGPGSGSITDGPFFAMRGNNFSRVSNQRGAIFFNSGQVSTPTGLDGSINFFSSSSFIEFQTTVNATSRLRIINNGNIGIGTASPTARLHVLGSGTTSSGTTFLTQSSGGTETFRILDNGQIGINNATPNASSILDISSTTLGVLPPRMSTTQKRAIASPAQGLTVYDTTIRALSIYDGNNWATAGGGEQTFAATGTTTNINFNNGNIADITLSSSTTITLSGGSFGTFIIKLTQDATGGRTVSWPSNVFWSGGIPPSLTTTGGKADIISLIFDGTNYYGTYALNF